jgi:RNA polymerase sigma factor (sigma-70 family)
LVNSAATHVAGSPLRRPAEPGGCHLPYHESVSRAPTDGELLGRAASGDQRAWDALVERLGSRVWAVARAHRLNKADAEDVFQITWMRLVAHMDGIREPDRVGAWLASTARHESLHLLRRSGRQVPTGDEFEFEGTDALAPAPDEQMLATERQAAVWDALATLAPPCQRLLRLMMADPPFTYEEITELLHMRQGSIGPTRRRCLEKLRNRLDAVSERSHDARPEEVPQ